MTNDCRPLFNGTYVPFTFKKLLLPTGDDPDGQGPTCDQDLILFHLFMEAIGGSSSAAYKLATEWYKHQKNQLKNSFSVADEEGRNETNMAIEDICPWLVKLGLLKPNAPDYEFCADNPGSRYTISPWVFPLSEREGVYLECVARVKSWVGSGSLELTKYPGKRPIDSESAYPSITLLSEELDRLLVMFGPLPPLTRAKSFEDWQFKKGQSGNPKGRPRRLREIEDPEKPRPHFFDCVYPDSKNGETYGQKVYLLARYYARINEDYGRLSQMAKWAEDLSRLRSSRKSGGSDGFSYHRRLEVTRIDIAIRHLELVTIQWPAKPCARWMINPWAISSALRLIEKEALSYDNMKVIYVRTRTPQHVDWPGWWPDELRSKHSRNEYVKRK